MANTKCILVEKQYSMEKWLVTKLSNISKFKIEEAHIIIAFFLLLGTITSALNSFTGIQLTVNMVSALLLGTATSVFEIVVSPWLQTKMNKFFNHLVSLFFYYLTFLVLVFLYKSTELVLVSYVSFSDALRYSVFNFFPGSISFLLFYYFIFIVILQRIKRFNLLSYKKLLRDLFRVNNVKPLTENRIFMFMDLESSTTYAESLGHQKYSSFISDIYKELDEYILETDGELYQYVGDEVVISWSLKDGISNNNCIRFYYLVEKRIAGLKEDFLIRYGVIPKFKAGLHMGHVTTTEVGSVLKKEIAYHGDTVNTTARICSMCKDLNKNLLLSEDVKEIMNDFAVRFSSESVGTFLFKGKKNEVSLYSVDNIGFVKEIKEERYMVHPILPDSGNLEIV